MLRALLACGFCVSVAFASVKSDIDKQYHRWAKATLNNDVDTILSVLAADYTLKTYTGTVITREKYEASLRKRKASKEKAAAYETKIASVEVAGSRAKVISDETSSKLTIDPVTNKKLNMIHIHRYLDTWVRSGKTWRLQSTVTQVESTKMEPVAAKKG